MDDEPRERHLNIHFSPEIMAGVYANFANVSHSDYEFTVTFARVDHEVDDVEVPGVVVTRVNLSPRFMRELIDAMEDNYSKWSTREGIRELPEFGTGAGEGTSSTGGSTPPSTDSDETGPGRRAERLTARDLRARACRGALGRAREPRGARGGARGRRLPRASTRSGASVT